MTLREELPISLRLEVTDPDMVAELSKHNGDERAQFAMLALKIGIQAVRNHGEVRLAYELFQHIPLLSRAAAVAMEVSHVEFLRSQGYAVWQR